MKLHGKVAVITGGSRGIGRAMVEEFAREGARVIFTYVKNAAAVDDIKKSLRDAPGSVEDYQVDVTDYTAVDAWKEKLLDTEPRIDILVNNAGIVRDGALVMMQPEDWHAVINTNLNGVFNTTKAFISTFMKQKAGTVLNISSLSGVIGLARQTNYAASKGGIIAFTKSLAREVAPFNIRVNCLAPGFIQTDMVAALKEEFLSDALSRVPVGRIGTAIEVAKAALFLVSEAAGYITGQVLRIDGGLS